MLWACSAEKKALPNRVYHNITAKYNAFWIAREQIREIEAELLENHKPNYNRILKIYPVVDSTIIENNKTKLNNIVKMSSLAIQRHKNSKWVDDSYILVGRARYYMAEFPEAIETFKYVNVKGEKDEKKHRALIELIRAFTDAEEYNNAQAVVDYLRRQKLNRANKVNYFKQTAYLHQTTGNIDFMVSALTEASKLAKRREDKARMHFIIGQVYQALGYEAIAYDNYKACIKNKPEYELYFYASLNMAQVTELHNSSDAKQVRKYFQKLLKDGKNVEYRDKIYYELGEFEYKRNNLDDAIEAYKSAVKNSVNNDRQKAYAYWKLGKLYFEDLKKYDLAKNYYDSTVQVMPQDEDVYERIAARQNVLADFIEQIVTIETQDSLLHLATLDSTQLDNIFIEIQIEKERRAEEEKRLAKKQKSRAAQQASAGFGGAGGGGFAQASGGTWYFYNATQISTGRNEFIQKWGNRKLEDNWRRLNKPISFSDEDDKKEQEMEEIEEIQLSKEELLEMERQQFYANIPFSTEQQEIAHEKIEAALYRLGIIYNFDLLEKSNATETFLKLIDRYPATEHRVEVLYLLYIYFKDKGDGEEIPYKEEILDKYPNSIYAKTIINPSYKEESENANRIVKEIYSKAYRKYELKDYAGAMALINEGINEYSENDYTDNLALLEVLIKGRTEGGDNYRFALTEFIEAFPDSELIDYANKLLGAIDRVQEREAKRKGQQYISYFDQKHYYIILYESNRALASLLPAEIDAFNQEHFEQEKLNTGNLVFDEKLSMILISEIKDKATAKKYYEVFNSDKSPIKDFGSVKFYNFAITKDNFEIFYQAREFELYKVFFEQNYLR